jgi:hypothetical protein
MYETKLKVSSELTCDPNGRNPFVMILPNNNNNNSNDNSNSSNDNNSSSSNNNNVVKIKNLFL